MFSRIVLATDFSEFSERAYAVGLYVASRYKSRVFVLHVVQPSRWSTYADPLGELDLEREVAVQVGEALEAVAQRFRAAGVDVVARHRAGDARVRIVQFAREVSAHAILLASHGHGGLYERLLGGTADRVVRRAGCPVLVASGHMPEDEAVRFDRVLFPFDLSAAGERQAEMLVEGLRPRLEELHVLHAAQPVVPLPLFPGGLPLPASTAGLEQMTEFSTRRLGELRERLAARFPDLRLVTELRFGGSQVHTILEYRRDHDLGLIALPASRESAEDPHYLGRTAESLLGKAHVPVLILK